MNKRPVARPARTAGQGTLSLALVEFLDAFIYSMNEQQYGAAVVLLTIIFSWLMAFVENKLGLQVLADE